MLPDPSKLSAEARSALAKLLDSAALEILRAEASVFALLPPDDGLKWEVDLGIPSFKEWVGDPPQLHVSGAAQLIATWSTEDETWLWGDANPSAAGTGTSRLFERLADSAELKALRDQPRFAIEELEARRLATVCASRAGFVGAWPGRSGSAIAYLALDPVVWPDSAVETADRKWCTFCGRVSKECAALVAGPGVNACDQCTVTLVDIKSESESSGGAIPQTMPPCLFCGGRDRRVFARYASICYGCIDKCARSLG